MFNSAFDSTEIVEVVTASEEEDQFFDDECQRQRRRIGYWLSMSFCFIGIIVAFTIIICLLRYDDPQPPGSTTTTTTTTTITTTTTTTITTTTIFGDFNTSCSTNSDCNTAAGLSCQGGVCLCNASTYWSYGSSTCTTCITGWGNYLDSCWVMAIGAFTYADAATVCSTVYAPAIIATTENANKYAYFQNAFISISPMSMTGSAWVNASATIPLTFFWPNGDPMNPSFWDSIQPNNSGGTPSSIAQSCVIYAMGSNYKFNDWWCDYQCDVFCEYYT